MPVSYGTILQAAVQVSGSTTLTPSQTGTTISNLGGTGIVTVNLPQCTSADAGTWYNFCVLSTLGIKLQCAAGDKIQFQSGSTSAGGTATCIVVGGACTVVMIAPGQWAVTSNLNLWVLT